MRAIASVALSFGLVSIPVKLYSATDASSAVRFKLMSQSGARVRQQYVAEGEPAEAPSSMPTLRSVTPSAPDLAKSSARPAPHSAAAASSSMPRGRGADRERVEAEAQDFEEDTGDDSEADDAAGQATPQTWRPVSNAGHGDAEMPSTSRHADTVERDEMLRGYEFEKGRFVMFTPAELKALKAASRDSIDIVAFIPDGAVDPVYFDKAYLVAPDKRGERTYALLLEALAQSGRTALAKWAWKGKEVVVQIRPAVGGLVLQQLFYADEVRLPAQLGLQLPPVGEAELQLALKLIEQGAQPAYDPTQFVDEERERILAAVEGKIAGGRVVSHAPARERKGTSGGQVIDLLDALRASLKPPPAASAPQRKPVARSGAAGSVTRLPTRNKTAAKKSQGR